MACRSPAAEGPYRVILKVSYGLTFAHASYHDGRWHGLRDHAAVVGFVPASLPTEGATP